MTIGKSLKISKFEVVVFEVWGLGKCHIRIYTSLLARKCCIILAVEDNENFDDKLQIYRRCDNTVKPVYYGHLGTIQKCPDYQGVLIFQVSLHTLLLKGNLAFSRSSLARVPLALMSNSHSALIYLCKFSKAG